MDPSDSPWILDLFSSSSSKLSKLSKYEVFLSYRREDTRRTFVSHLYRSLDQKGIRTYRDENPQTGDGRISPEITQAISDSKIAVVVMSENYASSAWCLDILATIIESSMVTKPVFYEVDPEDLTTPTGKFAENLRRHEARETPETVTRWRNALERLESSQPRFCSRNCVHDSKMLEDLIRSISYESVDHGVLSLIPDVYERPCLPESISTSSVAGIKELNTKDDSVTDDMSNEPASPPSEDSNGFIGMHHRKKAVYELLDLESKNHVRIIGIWGREGVGKTTLAECIFKDISSHFHHQCFLNNANYNHPNRISPGLLQHLTRTSHSNDSFDALKPSLVNQNVLLVLDGFHNEQFTDIVNVARWLGPGSRVIMTSTDEDSLVSCGVKYMYEMECLRSEEALKLFSLFAFRETYPLIGFEQFSIRAVHFAGRLPLALEVLGTHLYGKDEESWRRTLRKLEASQDNGSRQVSNYIMACQYLPRRLIEMEHHVREGEHSPSYHMLL